MDLRINGTAIGADHIFQTYIPGVVSSRVGDVEAHGTFQGDGWALIFLSKSDAPTPVRWKGTDAVCPPRRAPGTYGVVRLGAPLRLHPEARQRIGWTTDWCGFDWNGPHFAALQPEDIWPNTGQKGSPRVTWGAHEPAVAAARLGNGPLITATSIRALVAWADKQLTHRAVHEVEIPHDNGPPPTPPGDHWRTWDALHFELDTLAALVSLTNDPGAWISLRWHAEAAIVEGSRMVARAEDNTRAWGWVMQALATWEAVTKGHDGRARATLLHMADHLDTVCSEDPALPWVTLNEAARSQPDHQHAVSTWMTARAGLSLIRGDLTDRKCYRAAVASMRYAIEASGDGAGSHVLDYDEFGARTMGSAGHNPFGGHSTDASVHLLCWLSGEADLRAHAATYYERADCMRGADRNYKAWVAHCMGGTLGWR